MSSNYEEIMIMDNVEETPEMRIGNEIRGLDSVEVQHIIKQVLDEVIGTQPYNATDCSAWNQQAVENITRRLVAMSKPYKYIVSSSLLQISTGSGLNVSTISYWNKQTDQTIQCRWETRHMLAVVYVFAVAL